MKLLKKTATKEKTAHAKQLKQIILVSNYMLTRNLYLYYESINKPLNKYKSMMKNSRLI